MVAPTAKLMELHIFTSFECVHLGGGRGTFWVIECDKGKGGEKTDTFISIEANGGDINRASDGIMVSPCLYDKSTRMESTS